MPPEGERTPSLSSGNSQPEKIEEPHLVDKLHDSTLYQIAARDVLQFKFG